MIWYNLSTDLHLQTTAPISFGFQGKIKETIPYGIEFDLTEAQQSDKVVHTADLTATTIFGVYRVQGSLTDQSSDFLYDLDIDTHINGTEFFSLSGKWQNQWTRVGLDYIPITCLITISVFSFSLVLFLHFST